MSGTTHVSAGPVTTSSFTPLKVVFGRTFVPIVLTFFVSWKSDAERVAARLPALNAGAFAGIGKRATPLAGSYAAAPSTILL